MHKNLVRDDVVPYVKEGDETPKREPIVIEGTLVQDSFLDIKGIEVNPSDPFVNDFSSDICKVGDDTCKLNPASSWLLLRTTPLALARIHGVRFRRDVNERLYSWYVTYHAAAKMVDEKNKKFELAFIDEDISEKSNLQIKFPGFHDFFRLEELFLHLEELNKSLTHDDKIFIKKVNFEKGKMIHLEIILPEEESKKTRILNILHLASDYLLFNSSIKNALIQDDILSKTKILTYISTGKYPAYSSISGGRNRSHWKSSYVNERIVRNLDMKTSFMLTKNKGTKEKQDAIDLRDNSDYIKIIANKKDLTKATELAIHIRNYDDELTLRAFYDNLVNEIPIKMRMTSMWGFMEESHIESWFGYNTAVSLNFKIPKIAKIKYSNPAPRELGLEYLQIATRGVLLPFGLHEKLQRDGQLQNVTLIYFYIARSVPTFKSMDGFMIPYKNREFEKEKLYSVEDQQKVGLLKPYSEKWMIAASRYMEAKSALEKQIEGISRELIARVMEIPHSVLSRMPHTNILNTPDDTLVITSKGEVLAKLLMFPNPNRYLIGPIPKRWVINVSPLKYTKPTDRNERWYFTNYSSARYRGGKNRTFPTYMYLKSDGGLTNYARHMKKSIKGGIESFMKRNELEIDKTYVPSKEFRLERLNGSSLLIHTDMDAISVGSYVGSFSSSETQVGGIWITPARDNGYLTREQVKTNKINMSVLDIKGNSGRNKGLLAELISVVSNTTLMNDELHYQLVVGEYKWIRYLCYVPARDYPKVKSDGQERMDRRKNFEGMYQQLREATNNQIKEARKQYFEEANLEPESMEMEKKKQSFVFTSKTFGSENNTSIINIRNIDDKLTADIYLKNIIHGNDFLEKSEDVVTTVEGYFVGQDTIISSEEENVLNRDLIKYKYDIVADNILVLRLPKGRTHRSEAIYMIKYITQGQLINGSLYESLINGDSQDVNHLLYILKRPNPRDAFISSLPMPLTELQIDYNNKLFGTHEIIALQREEMWVDNVLRRNKNLRVLNDQELSSTKDIYNTFLSTTKKYGESLYIYVHNFDDINTLMAYYYTIRSLIKVVESNSDDRLYAGVAYFDPNSFETKDLGSWGFIFKFPTHEKQLWLDTINAGTRKQILIGTTYNDLLSGKYKDIKSIIFTQKRRNKRTKPK